MRKFITKFRTIERVAILTLISFTALMIFFALCRFMGIGYFANDYPTHEYNSAVQSIILFVFKLFDYIIILMILSKLSAIKNIIIATAFTSLFWFIYNPTLVFLIDSFYFLLLPFLINKIDYKTITKSVILYLAILAYQMIMLFARYEIDVVNKFNYIAGIASVIDYKLYLINIFLVVFIFRRIIMKQENLPNAEENNFGGGHCILFFGKFDRFCEIVGKVVVGICTLGIAPLVNYFLKKKKNKNESK